MRLECRERFPRHCGLAIPTYITACASSTCRNACRDRSLSVSFEVGGEKNVPGIPGACEIRNFTYLGRGPCRYVFLYCLSTPRIISKRSQKGDTCSINCSINDVCSGVPQVWLDFDDCKQPEHRSYSIKYVNKSSNSGARYGDHDRICVFRDTEIPFRCLFFF